MTGCIVGGPRVQFAMVLLGSQKIQLTTEFNDTSAVFTSRQNNQFDILHVVENNLVIHKYCSQLLLLGSLGGEGCCREKVNFIKF
mmetsp:Transcript_45931/g.55717  ORF Transcript_45931/g.55717 Transcript_45931/m.55717 type:complete len:85 (-) Transcript_45931:548-802(-)